MPPESNSHHHEDTTPRLESARVYLFLFFPPNKYFTCFTTFICLGILFLQSQRARVLSLTSGLVARTRCSHHCDPTSASDQKLKPHSKPLQAELPKIKVI